MGQSKRLVSKRVLVSNFSLTFRVLKNENMHFYTLHYFVVKPEWANFVKNESLAASKVRIIRLNAYLPLFFRSAADAFIRVACTPEITRLKAIGGQVV